MDRHRGWAHRAGMGDRLPEWGRQAARADVLRAWGRGEWGVVVAAVALAAGNASKDCTCLANVSFRKRAGIVRRVGLLGEA